MNLFNLAKQNSTRIKNKYIQLRSSLKNEVQEEKFDEIESILSKWRISLNLTLEILFKILQQGEYKNIFSVKKEELERLLEIEEHMKITEKEAVKRHLKNYYFPRVCFNQEFDKSENFKYGAFNIGGLGIEKYGEFCLIIKEEFCLKHYSYIAFLKEDSLSYFDMGKIEINKLAYDLSNRECAPNLTMIKYFDLFDGVNLESIPNIICNNKDYVEVIIEDKILIEHFQSIRLSKLNYNYFKDILYKAYISEAEKYERMKLMIYEHVFQHLKEKNIRLLLI